MALPAKGRQQGIANGRRVRPHLAWGFGGGSEAIALENLGRHSRKQVHREVETPQVRQFLQFGEHTGHTNGSWISLELTKHRGDDGRIVTRLL